MIFLKFLISNHITVIFGAEKTIFAHPFLILRNKLISFLFEAKDRIPHDLQCASLLLQELNFPELKYY